MVRPMLVLGTMFYTIILPLLGIRVANILFSVHIPITVTTWASAFLLSMWVVMCTVLYGVLLVKTFHRK